MGAPRILAYPPETVVAEKFEAMVRLGEANSRLKDFNDIWAIMSTFNFEMATLVQALVIGPEPDAGKKSLGFISLYVLIIGLIGMIIVPIYAIKNSKKSSS
jgi:hypothetical protein